MRIDSCRACGSKPDVIEKCTICPSPLKLKCPKCNNYIDDPMHTHQ